MKCDNPIIAIARQAFHRELIHKGVLSVNQDGVPSNSDGSNQPSLEIGRLVAIQLGAKVVKEKLSAQSAGRLFESIVGDFLKATFPLLQHLRPGNWEILNLGNTSTTTTSSFVQYEHLSYLSEVIDANRELATMIGNDYMVAPDIVIARELCDEKELNGPRCFVDDKIGLKADIRKINGGHPLMHASISAKWTMRSDRAQNSRTEALNLIRNRKGHLPHIVVVTGEPLPSRLASLALGTGDIDCVYHFSLYELVAAVKEYGKNGREDIIEQLDMLIEGKRLKDISDLPLDLCC